MGQSSSTSGQFYQQLQPPLAPSSSTGPASVTPTSSSNNSSDGGLLRGDADNYEPFDENLTEQISELAGKIEVSKKSPEYVYTVAERLLHCNLERVGSMRKAASEIVVGMLRKKMVNRMDFQNILNGLLEITDELVIDLPKIWECLADYYVPPLHERLITLQDVRQIAVSSFKDVIEYRWLMLEGILKSYEATHGKSSTEKLWSESPLDVSEFFNSSTEKASIRQTVVNAKLGYLYEYQEKEVIRQLLENNLSNEDVFKRIDAYATEQQMDTTILIRTLTTAVFEHCITNGKLEMIKLERWHPLLQRYLCGKGERELEALNAIQRLMVKLQHPQNLLQTIFVNLDELGVIMDGFKRWLDPANANHEPEGRGVCVKSTTQFFENFSEPEDDDGGKDGDSDEDEKGSDSKETI